MADPGNAPEFTSDGDVRRIHWTEALPFLKLFGVIGCAFSPTPVLLGTLAVISLCVVGWVADFIWVRAGGGVLQQPAAEARDEIRAYGSMRSSEFVEWCERAREAAAERPESRATLAELRRDALAFLDARVAAARAAARQNAQQRDALHRVERAADLLRVHLHGRSVPWLGNDESETEAVDTLEEVAGAQAPETQAAERATLERALQAAREVREARAARPRGPFVSLYDYEMDCLAGAIRGVVTGRWVLGGSAFSGSPSLLGSVRSGLGGLAWLVTKRPVYAVGLVVFVLVAMGFLGTAISRYVAVRYATQEALEAPTALAFARQRLGSALVAPLFPLGALVGGGLLVVIVFAILTLGLWAVSAFIGLIPLIGGWLGWLDEVVPALFFVLALLAGVGMAFVLLYYVVAIHLAAPAIAVDGCEGISAVQNAYGFSMYRPWSTGFYALLVVIYMAIGVAVVRVMALVGLKLSHDLFGAGLGLFGLRHADGLSSVSKLDAMWRMPSWQELALLPRPGGSNLWGSLAPTALSASEAAGAGIIGLWVFLLVALVGGLVVSLYFAGCTGIYVLLRRESDGTDLDEVFLEPSPPEDQPGPTAGAPASGPTAGSPLPVMKS